MLINNWKENGRRKKQHFRILFQRIRNELKSNFQMYIFLIRNLIKSQKVHFWGIVSNPKMAHLHYQFYVIYHHIETLSSSHWVGVSGKNGQVIVLNYESIQGIYLTMFIYSTCFNLRISAVQLYLFFCKLASTSLLIFRIAFLFMMTKSKGFQTLAYSIFGTSTSFQQGSCAH